MKFSPFAFAKLGTQAISELTQSLDRLTAGHLWAKIVLALAGGMLTGFLIGPEMGLVPATWSQELSGWLALPGQLFLGLIQLVVIPLVFSSVVLGVVSGENVKQLRTLGIKAGLYYLLTTIVAISIGLTAALLIRPGDHIDKSVVATLVSETDSAGLNQEVVAFTPPSITEMIPQLLPNNPYNALADGQMLQVVLLALFIGIAMMTLAQSEAKPLIDLFNASQKISMVVIGWAMRLAPIAVFGLMAKLLSQIGFNIMSGLAVYIVTVTVGLLAMIVFYLSLISIISRKNPFSFLKNIREVQLLAFSTSSSASVMPLTLKTAESKLGISPVTSQFIIPLGTTINMDGTALYQGVATVFMAQVFGVDLSVSQLILVVVTATMASIGAPGTPGVGMAILATILTSVGIPASGIVLILGVDRILDMSRTVVNVTGDLTAAQVLDSYQGHEK